MTHPGIYFVGGASGAGKTQATQRLAQRYSMPLIEIDDLQRSIMPAVPEVDRRGLVTRAMTRELLSQLIHIRASCLIDGAWLEPAEARDLALSSQGRFHPVYCGYSADDLECRYALMREDGRHWLTREPESWARAFLEKQATYSLACQQQCRELHIDYVDFTSFTDGSDALQKNFSAWLRHD